MYVVDMLFAILLLKPVPSPTMLLHGLTVTISCRNIFEFSVHKWYIKVLIYLFTDKMHTGNTLKLICIGTTKHFCFLVVSDILACGNFEVF